MFVREGIKAVRMDDIAREAGISKRTLYETFGDKDELIFFAMKHHFSTLDLENQEIGKSAPNLIVAMLEVMRNIIRHSETNWTLLNTLRKFHPSIHRRLHNDGADLRYAQLKHSLEFGVEEGTIDGRINLDLAINMLYIIGVNVIFDSVEIPITLPETVSPQHALLEMITYTLRGIATPKGVEIIEEYWGQINNA